MFWEDVGDDIWRFVRDSFTYGQFSAPVSDTLMVLILKYDNPTTFKDFRPISLCNVLYKIVTKVLVQRLRPFLGDLISPLQSSFIPGRGTKDNTILLQEIVFQMQKSKKKKGDMIFKLDLEKAYDRVDWDFLRNTLQVFGFPPVIISLIMHGIHTTDISLLWNGNKTPGFTPVRGLRQGDPLSPYLFVLCMERLGDMINQEVQAGKWTPISPVQDGS